MSYLVVLVVDDTEKFFPVLKAWEQAGVAGMTILDSTGLGRVRSAGQRDDLPFLISLSDLFLEEEIRHRTIFSVVETQEMVDRMVAVARTIIGDLNEPHTGFLFVVPVLLAIGLGKNRTERHLE